MRYMLGDLWSFGYRYHSASNDQDSRRGRIPAVEAEAVLIVRGGPIWSIGEDRAKEFCEWASSQSRTTFDKNVVAYPRAIMLATENSRGTVAYLLAQPVIMAEVFIPNPESSNLQKAASLGLFDKELIETAKSVEVGDVYTFVPDMETEYADKIQNHGWVEVEGVRLFKKSTGVTVNGRS